MADVLWGSFTDVAGSRQVMTRSDDGPHREAGVVDRGRPERVPEYRLGALATMLERDVVADLYEGLTTDAGRVRHVRVSLVERQVRRVMERLP